MEKVIENSQMIESKESFLKKFISKIKDFFRKKDIFDMVIFDLDGTLWSVEETTLISINEYLEKNGYEYRVTMDDVKGTMGCTFAETADRYFPMLETREERDELLTKVLDYNNERLTKVGGKLYPNLEETLKVLKGKYRISIVSNCAGGYIEAFLDSSGLSEYFEDFMGAAKEKLSKADTIKKMIQRNNVKNAIYIGDTIKDKEAAEGAGIKFVQALYGFGENLNTTYSINEINLLPNLLKDIRV